MLTKYSAVSEQRQSLETVGLATVALVGKQARAALGGEWAVASCIVSELCRVQKCRAADDLLATAQRDPQRAREVWERDVDLDALEDSVFRDLLTHMMEDPRNISFCAHLLFCSKNIERIGDHATNIAETVVYLVTGEAMPSERPHGRQETDIDIEAAGGDL